MLVTTEGQEGVTRERPIRLRLARRFLCLPRLEWKGVSPRTERLPTAQWKMELYCSKVL